MVLGDPCQPLMEASAQQGVGKGCLATFAHGASRGHYLVHAVHRSGAHISHASLVSRLNCGSGSILHQNIGLWPDPSRVCPAGLLALSIRRQQERVPERIPDFKPEFDPQSAKTSSVTIKFDDWHHFSSWNSSHKLANSGETGLES